LTTSEAISTPQGCDRQTDGHLETANITLRHSNMWVLKADVVTTVVTGEFFSANN